MKPGHLEKSPRSLIALLALAALVPVVGVLWFMNAAMRNERLAAQERLGDLYRTQIGAAQRQLAAFWQERQAALQSAGGGGSPAQLFAAVVRDELADSVVFFDRTGLVTYPETGQRVTAAEEDADWMTARELEFQKQDISAAAAAYARIAESAPTIHIKARARQAQAACLLKGGQTRAALACLSPLAGDPTLRQATNVQGTLIAPNAQLLMLKLLSEADSGLAMKSDVSLGSERDSRSAEMPSQSPRQQTFLRLVQRLNDYSDRHLPASQRRFLMQEVAALAPNEASFPTLTAEKLAAEFLEHAPPRTAESKLLRSPVPNVWQFTGASYAMVALFREERLKSMLVSLVRPVGLTDGQINLVAPGEAVRGSKLVPPQDAGEFLPGWRLALSFNGPDPLAAASARQNRFYLGTGLVVVLAIAVVAFLVARYVAAQMRLARLKNELVSTVSHELKTPLASMRALVDTLAAGRYRDERQLRDYLDLIGRENLRLSSLIDNFLTFSRLERGRQQFRFESLEPARVVGAAADALKEKLQAANCTFAQQVEPGLPCIRGDADALSTVLINLLDNAYKYTDAEKRISARAYAHNGHVCFEIADNGIGIARSETGRIFDRFYQVDQSLTRQRGGCGLGLGIVQYIVRAHDGAVQVESEPGRGSTFRVSIPLATFNA